MKRILLACFLLAACHKEGSEGPARRAVSDAPPPPAIQLPSTATISKCCEGVDHLHSAWPGFTS